MNFSAGNCHVHAGLLKVNEKATLTSKTLEICDCRILMHLTSTTNDINSGIFLEVCQEAYMMHKHEPHWGQQCSNS